MEPGNTEVWLRLADFQLNRLKDPKSALRSLAAALYLDPHNPSTVNAYLQVSRIVTGKTPAVGKSIAPAPPQPQSTQPGAPAPVVPPAAG